MRELKSQIDKMQRVDAVLREELHNYKCEQIRKTSQPSGREAAVADYGFGANDTIKTESKNPSLSYTGVIPSRNFIDNHR